MKKRLLLLLPVLLLASQGLLGQRPDLSPEKLEIKTLELKQRAAPILKDFMSSREQAMEMAEEKGWVIHQVLPTGEVIALQGLDAGGMPVYYITDYNTRAAATTSTNQLWPGGNTGLNLSGSSAFLAGKIAIWDGGSVLDTHQELAGRIILNDGAAVSNHSTHVAGTMIAAGVNPLARGMAFGAPNLRSWDFNNDGNEMTDAASGLIISNHSYGRVTGWNNNSSRAGTASDPNWEWRGNPNVSSTEDYNFGYYDDRAKLWDMISYYSPHYLIVKSAGNNRNTNGPAVGSPFWRYNASMQWELVTARPSGISSNDGYDIISTYGTAKNILTVGAVNAIEDGYRKAEDVVMSTFSSWGPTDDGRIKPDLVANGVSLYSSSSAGDVNYSISSGTSMSAPNTSGSLVLLQEHYHLKYGRFMLSSTLKGLVCHTADEAGNPGPDYRFGWGLLNAKRAAEAISNNGSSSLIEEIAMSNGQTITREVVASGTEPMIISICWTDPEAEPLPINPTVLNNRTPRLVNDLDLRVSDGNQTFLPWRLDPENPEANATRGDNTVDNIEQVLIEHPVPGKTYTITITHKKDQLIRGPQDFALIATGIGGTAMCASGPASDADSRINGFLFHTLDNNTTTGGCTTYRNYTTTPIIVQAGNTYPFTVRAGSCGAENPRIIKLFADWNANGTFDSNELVATSAVINTSSDFSGSIQIPGYVTPGSTAILRVVLSETTDPDQVMPCGEYAKGETQDYLLVFQRPEKDVYPSVFINLANGICAREDQIIELTLENVGKQNAEGIVLSARVFEGETLIKSFEENFAPVLESLTAATFRSSGSFSTKPGTNYLVEVVSRLTGDVNASNDTLRLAFTTAAEPALNDISAIQCEGSSDFRLTADAAGPVFWYDQATGGNILAIGNNQNLASVPESRKLYAGVNNFSGRIGPPTKNSEPWTGGTYARITSHPFIRTEVPLVIESARLYVGYPGTVTFYVEEFESGAVISTTTLYVSATRTPPDPGTSAADDLTDQGMVYPLNLSIPTPGNYRLRVTYGPGTTLYRATSRTYDPYPYTLANIMEMYSTSAGTPTGFYYWLYDIKIGPYGCSSSIREVDVETKPKPVVDLQGTQRLENGQIILDAGNPGSAYLWNTGASTQTIAPTSPGAFTVTVTNQWGCVAQGSITLTVTSVDDPADIGARVFPNPASNRIYIESPREVMVEMTGLTGQKVFVSENPARYTLIDVSGIKPGIYLIRLIEPGKGQQAVYRMLVQ